MGVGAWRRASPPRARESPACRSVVGNPIEIPIDPNGNLTQKTEGTDVWTYSWNAENQLVKVEKNSIEQARFAYDPLGRRVEKVAGGVTTTDAFDGGAILREIRGSTTLKYVHGPRVDEPIALDDGTSLVHLHADGLGSVVKMTNAAGAVTLTRQYDAWGDPDAGASEPGYAFTGREWDPETGIYYYRARYYDSGSARFLSEDPPAFLGAGDGLSKYVYVGDNPAGFSDPSGLSRTSCDLRTPPGPPPPTPPRNRCPIRYCRIMARGSNGLYGCLLVMVTAGCKLAARPVTCLFYTHVPLCTPDMLTLKPMPPDFNPYTPWDPNPSPPEPQPWEDKCKGSDTCEA